EDMQFLGDHVVAQEVSVLGGNRGAIEGRFSYSVSGNGELTLPGGSKTTLKGINIRGGQAVVPGFQQIDAYTRRVEYPTDVSAGRITDTFSSSSLVTLKQRDVVAAGVTVGGSQALQGQFRNDANYELALANTSISYSQGIPPGTTVDLGTLAKTPPDFTKPATVESSVMTPTAAEAAGLALGTFNPLGGTYHQAPGGQQRLDMNRDYKKYEVSGFTGLGMAASMSQVPGLGGFVGNISSGLRQGDFIDTRMDVVKRDGHNTTQTLRAGATGYIAAEGSLSRLSGVDDYDTADPVVPPDPTPPADPTEPTKPVEPEPVEPKPDPTHWQVQPFHGVNVRSSPTTDADNKVAIVQSGSFLDGTGETKVDKDGYTWIKVNGRDQEDKMVEGWVRGDNLKAYDKRYGDNDATGRVNPALEKKDQDKIIVKHDDNLWNLAAKHGQDFDKLLAANPHLLDPNLIFKGDSVYLPGR
ncbi:LysM peptidoglycan-binding domain-containing protein, partial [Ottowia sp.]|uniref:LysM peptidoglycan-binding domain-containing protein n=1 Tax=Ottowia sp. TaxID=1898956 RepID=UPI0039E6A187